MRSEVDIENEILALQNLKPTGPHKDSIQARFDLMIEELEWGVDDTAEEWDDLSDCEQDAVMSTRRWKEGDSNDRPSEGWEAFTE